MLNKVLGLFMGVIFFTIAFAIFVPGGEPTPREWRLFGLGFVASMLSGIMLGAWFNKREEINTLQKKLDDWNQVRVVFLFSEAPEAIEKSLKYWAKDWLKSSQALATYDREVLSRLDKGEMITPEQVQDGRRPFVTHVETAFKHFNDRYDLAHRVYGGFAELRERDVMAYLQNDEGRTAPSSPATAA